MVKYLMWNSVEQKNMRKFGSFKLSRGLSIVRRKLKCLSPSYIKLHHDCLMA